MRLNPNHPALSENRTIHTKTIRNPFDSKNVLKPANANTKLGKRKNIITKGIWKGLRMFSLTLPERSTCPTDCIRWDSCYGNNMPFAHRFETGQDLESKILKELTVLQRKHPEGIVVRLHVLGDFYSVQYTKMWACALSWFPTLKIFGYTARHHGPILDGINALNRKFPDRCVLRVSRNLAYNEEDGPTRYASDGSEDVKGFICPEMTGQTESCLTCGLCWTVNKTVIFPDHDELRKAKK
jgi:hypothetical protein